MVIRKRDEEGYDNPLGFRRGRSIAFVNTHNLERIARNPFGPKLVHLIEGSDMDRRKWFLVQCGRNCFFDRFRVGVWTLILVASLTSAWGQLALSSQTHLQTADPPDLARGYSPAALSCQVSPGRPYLGFDLRFHAGYRAALPIKMLAEAGESLDIALRVKPTSHGDPVYLVQRVSVPHFPPEANGMGWLAGGFEVGPGRYQVEWMMRDTVGRACTARWDLNVRPGWRERNVPLSLRENTVAERIANPFEGQSQLAPAGQPLRLKILLNVSPAGAEQSLLNPQYAAVLLSMLRGIVSQPGATRLTLVAFNLRAQKVVYQQDDVEQIDFSTLGKALDTATGTIDYRLLKDKKSETHFVTNLLIEQLGRKAGSQDAIVIMGPKVSLDRKVSVQMLRAGGAASCPIFYLNYNPNPLEDPFPDTIGSALKAYSSASKYDIERPRDFGAAMKDMLLRLGKQPASVAAFSK